MTNKGKSMKQGKRIGMLASVLLVMATAQQAHASTNDIEDAVKSFLVEQGKQLTVEVQTSIQQSLSNEIQKFSLSLPTEIATPASANLSRNEQTNEKSNTKSVEE